MPWSLLPNLDRKDESEDDDLDMAETLEFCIDVATDADGTSKAECQFDDSMRSSFQEGEIEDYYEESRLRRFWRRN